MKNKKPQLHLRRGFQIFNGILLRNPILITGLVLAPAVVAAYSLSNALALSAILFMVTLPTLLVASLVSRFLPKIPREVLPIIYVLTAGLMLIPSFLVIQPISPDVLDSIGIYGPLLAFNSILFSRAKHYPRRKKPHWALLDGIMYCLGFTLAICLVGAIREVLGAGTLLGRPFDLGVKFNGLLMPFGGCILVGLLSAFFRRLVDELRRLYRWGRKKYLAWRETRKKPIRFLREGE